MKTETLARSSAIIAVVCAAALILLSVGLRSVGRLSDIVSFARLPMWSLAILVLNGVLVPTSILGMGLGATALIRNPETNRLAVAGVLGNGCYLFLGSMLLLFSL